MRRGAIGAIVLGILATAGPAEAQSGISGPLGSVPTLNGSAPGVGGGERSTGGGIPAVSSGATAALPSPTPQDSGSSPVYGSSFEGIASWYGAAFAGRKTASGEIYDPEGMTAAHLSLPFGTLLRVTDLDTGASAVVRVNDRGPYVAGRILDLSEAAARLIGLLPSGTARVRCQILRPEDAVAFGAPPQNTPTKPSTSSAAQSQGRLCRVQVASYSVEANARATLERLRLSGIIATLETAGSWKRVVIAKVQESDLDALIERLASLGYRRVLVSFGT